MSNKCSATEIRRVYKSNDEVLGTGLHEMVPRNLVEWIVHNVDDQAEAAKCYDLMKFVRLPTGAIIYKGKPDVLIDGVNMATRHPRGKVGDSYANTLQFHGELEAAFKASFDGGVLSTTTLKNKMMDVLKEFCQKQTYTINDKLSGDLVKMKEVIDEGFRLAGF